MSYKYDTIEKVDRALKTHDGANWFENIDPACLDEEEVIKLIDFVKHLWNSAKGVTILVNHIISAEPFNSNERIAQKFFTAFSYVCYNGFPFSDKLRNNRRIMLLAAISDGRNFEFADKFNDDKDFVMTMLEYSYANVPTCYQRDMLQCMSKRLQNDEDIKKIIKSIEKGYEGRLEDAVKYLAFNSTAFEPDKRTALRKAGLLGIDIDALGVA